MTVVATVDIGTNSVLLFVARREAGALVPIVERAEVTRIGRGVDATGRLGAAGIEATLAVLRRYAALARDAGAETVAAVATSALRDADNGADFLGPAERILGRAVEVVSGRREAELTHRGAIQGLELGDRAVTVFDVGGGSTEIVRGRAGAIEAATSLDVGSVRLTERHLCRGGVEPCPDDELSALADAANDAIAGSPVRPGTPLVGIAGTVTTLLSLRERMATYEPSRVHGARLGASDVAALVARLAPLSARDRAALPGLDPKRADVIVAGAILVREVMRAAGADELIVSNGGVRVGLADELLPDIEGHREALP